MMHLSGYSDKLQVSALWGAKMMTSRERWEGSGVGRRGTQEVPVIVRVSYVVNDEKANRVLDLLAEGMRRTLVRHAATAGPPDAAGSSGPEQP